jgi:hypothetical protein
MAWRSALDLVALETRRRPVVARVVEGVPHHALDSPAGEHGGFERELGGTSAMQSATDARVLTLGVLAHDDDVDVARLDRAQRADHTGNTRAGRRFTY